MLLREMGERGAGDIIPPAESSMESIGCFFSQFILRLDEKGKARKDDEFAHSLPMTESIGTYCGSLGEA